MKKLVGKNTRLLRRANWLIRHRWYAIIMVVILAVAGKVLFLLNVNSLGIFFVAVFLVIENIICLLNLKKIKFIRSRDKQFKYVKRNINFQISYDLLVLTILIHYTGGIESPFISAYFFHAVVVSILLSQKESFLQTTFAVLLLSLVTLLEYNHILDHYCVCFSRFEAPNPNLYSDPFNYIKTLSAFIISFYTLVYISSAIGKRLRNQEEHYTNAIIRLNKKDRIKNEYVLRLTHDIKGHISAIQSSLSVVKTGIFAEIDPKNKEFIDRAYKRTYAVIKFIKDLLRLTKMRLSDDFERKTFSFKNMLIECFNDVKSHAEVKSIKLSSEFDPKVDIIKGDEFSLKEITSNMMLNAVKYTPVNGKIRLEAYVHDNFIRVIISDSGIGVPEDDMLHIFDEFYRGSNVDKKKIEGTGVGLAIAKNVIKQHKGTIWVENNPAGGSKFIYDIPINLK